MSVLLCGAARRVITPSVGTALYGYQPGVFRYVALHPLTDDADSRLIAESLRIFNEKGDTI